MESTTKRIVVPETLTWDKLCALYITVVYRLGMTFDAIELIFEDELSGQPVPPGVLDIDVRRKYHELRYGSATEVVATIYQLMDVPGMSHLLEILAKNNGSGYLKDFPQSLVALIRKMYEVSHNVSSHDHRVQVVQLFWPVMETYFAAAAVNVDHVELTEQPFTLWDYEVMLNIARGQSGLTLEDNKHLGELGSAFEKAGRRDQQAVERAQNIEPVKFGIRVQGGGSTFGHLIVSDDSRIAGKYFKTHHGELAVLVVRKRSGNVAIFVRGDQNLKPLYEALDKQEPGIWYLKVPDTPGKSPMLLNGSDSKTQPPTKLSDSELMDLIGRHFVHVPRSNRQRDDHRTEGTPERTERRDGRRSDRPARPAPVNRDDRPAKPQSHDFEPREFGVRSNGHGSATGHLIVTDDPIRIGEYFREHGSIAVLVIRIGSGNTRIHVRGNQDLWNLYEVLNEQEPSLWVLHERPGESPRIVNDSHDDPQKGSSLSDERLMSIVGRSIHYSPPPPRRQDNDNRPRRRDHSRR